MGILDLFSKRQERLRGKFSDVYQYDVVPPKFRAQLTMILKDSIGCWRKGVSLGPSSNWFPNYYWNDIFESLRKELGEFRIAQGGNPFDQCMNFAMNAPTEQLLDLIELSCQYIQYLVSQLNPYQRDDFGLTQLPDDAIEEINARFKEHGVGYEYVDGRIIRIDSQLIHTEAVKPALSLLHGAGKSFAGPLDEFLSAFEKYRQGKYKDAIHDANKAFESTLKAGCTTRRWAFDPLKDTANKLIQIVFDNGLFPSWLLNQFTSLRTVLESGTPVVRNKLAGHGQGVSPTQAPAHMARYALNMTASAIVFLIEAHQTA